MFSMNDIDGTGVLSKEEFSRMLRFDRYVFFFFFMTAPPKSFSCLMVHLCTFDVL